MISASFTDKHKSSAAHISRQLINFVKSAINYVPTEIWITKISNDKVVGFAYSIFVVLEIYTTDPEPFRLQAFD